jgi:subtilisin family serine protease
MKSKIFRVVTALVTASMLISAAGTPAAVAQGTGPGTGERILVDQQFGAAREELTGAIDLAKFIKEDGSIKVVIEMSTEPAVVRYAQVQPQGEIAAINASQTQLAKIESEQAVLLSTLTASDIDATVIYTVQRVYNGIAVKVDASKLDQIKALPGVKGVYPLISKSVDNAYSVPLIGAPELWQLASSTIGTGISVAVIDTGIDYTHADFGGSGLPEDFENNNPAIVEPGTFPTVKVVGGHDFVGNSYNANGVGAALIPVPDDDPLDCYGHGTHVAGTIGGYGVNTDGSTFTDDYSVAFDPTLLKIGPGVAPGVDLYSLKVFGCNGSTDVTDQAIEWAVDPNGDADFSDHLDVINMSLGSDFGGDFDSTAVASNNAALAGVLVVASSGNSGDTTYVTGSPGSATRVISVAASVDAGEVMDGFLVNSPAGLAGVKPSSNAAAYNWVTGLPATGDLLYPDTNRGGCSAFPAGTFTGKIALLDWTHNADGNNECGSVARTANAVNAGANGVIIAYDLDILDIAITGSAVKPSTITTKQVGDALKAAIDNGDTVNVTVTAAYNATVVNEYPPMIDMMASFSSRGARRGDSFLKPDITAPGMTIFSAQVGSGTAGESMNGTSMAAPHIAGVMALLRQMYPDWSVEELKALAMNSADKDIYTDINQTGYEFAPSRVGAGRVDLGQALDTDILMYNAEDGGAVSVSFGAPEISAVTTLTKSVKLVNKTDADITVTLSYDAVTDIPGVEYTLSDDQVLVPANGSAEFSVEFSANPALMDHPFDPAESGSPDLRIWLSEESGYIYASYNATSSRLPVYSAPRPASMMAATNVPVLNTVDGLGTSSVILAGQGLDTWALANSDPSEDITSLVTALQLAGTSSELPDLDYGKKADLQYVGVMSDWHSGGSQVYFGVSTYQPWSTPSEVQFNIYIDVDQDGEYDYQIFNMNYGWATGSDPTDDNYTIMVNLHTGDGYFQSDLDGMPLNSNYDTALFNSSVMVLPVYFSTTATPYSVVDPDLKFNYYVESYVMEDDFGEAVDSSGVYTYDINAMGIDTSGGYAGSPIWKDLPGYTVDFSYDIQNGVDAKQVLLLHHHNTNGSKAEVVTIIDTAIMMPFVTK